MVKQTNRKYHLEMDSRPETLKDLQQIITNNNLHNLRKNRHHVQQNIFRGMAGGNKKMPDVTGGTYLGMNLLSTPLAE